LVAEDAPLGHCRHVALEDVQIRAADRGRVDLDDHVGRLLDARIGDRVPRLFTGSAVYECLHVLTPFRTQSDHGGVTEPLQRPACGKRIGWRAWAIRHLRRSTATWPRSCDPCSRSASGGPWWRARRWRRFATTTRTVPGPTGTPPCSPITASSTCATSRRGSSISPRPSSASFCRARRPNGAGSGCGWPWFSPPGPSCCCTTLQPRV